MLAFFAMSEDVEPDDTEPGDEPTEAMDLTAVNAQLTALTGLLEAIEVRLAPQEEEPEEEPTKVAMLFALLGALASPAVVIAAVFFAGILTYEVHGLGAGVQQQIQVSQAQWRATRKSDLLDTLYRRSDCRLAAGDPSTKCPVKASIRARAEAALEYNQLVVDASGAQAPVDYSRVDLRGASLLVADLQRVNFHDAMLQGANLGLANLMHANLQGAKMLSVDLQGGKLQHANLQNADLGQSNLQDANLEGANLQGTNLRGANLQGIIGVNKYQIHGACIDAKTRLPDTLLEVKTSTAACTPWREPVNAVSP